VKPEKAQFIEKAVSSFTFRRIVHIITVRRCKPYTGSQEWICGEEDGRILFVAKCIAGQT